MPQDIPRTLELRIGLTLNCLSYLIVRKELIIKVGLVTKSLRGSRNPNTHIRAKVGVANYGPKINKPKTMLVGALLVATGLLSGTKKTEL